MATTSAEYWKNREAEQLKHNIADEKEYTEQLEKIYRSMISEIEKQTNGFYGKYATTEGITISEAKKRAETLEIEAYSEKAAKYVAEKDFSDQANAEMRLYNMTMKANRLELLKSQIGLELVSGFNEVEQIFDGALNDRAIAEYERLAGILGSSVSNSEKTANAIVNASFHNATYSDRIWMYQDMLKNELASLLQSGLIQRQNPRQLATHLRKRFGVSQYNAERLMRTELARVQIEAQKQALLAGGFKYYTFLALETACKDCLALDGIHFELEKLQPGVNAPPIHPNCRCSIAGYENSASYEDWVNALDSGENITWEDYKAGLGSGETIKAKDVTEEYLRNARAGEGNIRYDDGYNKSTHTSEIEMAQWVHDNLGGDITLLNEINKNRKKTPDYLWNDKYWELKSVTTETAANSAVRKAMKQIAENVGGVILDYGKKSISFESLENQILRRMKQTEVAEFVDIIVLSDGGNIRVYRYKK